MNTYVHKNRGGYILFVLLLIGTLIFIIALVTFYSMRNSMKTAGTKRTNVCAFNIAEAGNDHGLAQLRGKLAMPVANTAITILDSVQFGKETCQGSYTVRCSSNTAKDTLWLRSRGIAGNQSVTIQVVCSRYSVFSKMTFAPTAAISARTDVKTTGNIIIDGRDWDSTGARTIGNGVYGVSTCRTFENDQGTSSVGGNGNEPPQKGEAENSVEQHADSMNFPRTPEEVLGLSQGSLDPYIVNSLPSMPFHGIVYLNTSGSVSFDKYDLSGSSGILIVHDSSNHSGTGTATMDGVHGNFKGIIISDRINQLNSNGEIYGAIIALSQLTFKDIFGNGNPKVRYSSQVLQNLLNYVDQNSLKYYIDIISWKEL
jgi:Tfp pilus assembly protein PilX